MLVEVRRGETIESVHRGTVVQVGIDGEIERSIGTPSTRVLIRSSVKPFALVALIESGAADDLELTPSELALMAASHTGEDKHVRTLQSIFRRASVSQQVLACGSAGAPVDQRTRARLARDGETPGPIRQGCSGFHAASILMSRYADWSLEDYADPRHASQKAIHETVARLFGQKLAKLEMATDDCGVATYAMPLVEVARAYLLLADPDSAPADKPRGASAAALKRIRDAMIGAPDMVGGTYDVLDTELMRQREGLIISKYGSEGLQAIGLIGGPGARGPAPAGVAISIEDGDHANRASGAVALEALAQMRSVDERDLRALARFHRPITLGPDGAEIAVTIPRFELASVEASA